MSPLLLHSNTNQYNINGLLCTYMCTPRCFAYRHAATTFYQLQRGFGGRRQHERIQEFLSVLFSPQLILQFKEGFQWFIFLRKLYLYFTKDPEGVHYFPGAGGGGGVQILISIETHIRACYFSGGVSGPPIPLWIRTWGIVIITGQYLSQSGL